MNKNMGRLRRWFNKLGPGFITGAADDDPSGIATYSIAGAQFGYKLNWLSLFLLPSMIAIQEMCGRIGMVSGRGLAGIIKKYHSKKLLLGAVGLLVVANIINIGADLGIIAASIQMIVGFNYYYWLGVVAIIIILMEISIPYRKYSAYLKWLGLSLGVYIITAFLVHQDWREITGATLIPHIDFKMEYLMTMIGFLGTTISPYLFFWQASDEIEEEIIENKIKDFDDKPKIKKTDIRRMGFDTKAGMVFSNLITFFILLTTAATLHVANITEIETPQQAALALRPLAGNFAYLLFAVGIIGIGWQSIPVLAGSLGYALSEAFDYKEGLSKSFSKAKPFYLIIAVSTAIGVIIDALHINVMQALYYAAVVNGIAAVPLIAIIIKLADDKRVVGKYKSGGINRTIAWITCVFMATSVIMMLYNLFVRQY